jgi:hypothetical protein
MARLDCPRSRTERSDRADGKAKNMLPDCCIDDRTNAVVIQVHAVALSVCWLLQVALGVDLYAKVAFAFTGLACRWWLSVGCQIAKDATG